MKNKLKRHFLRALNLWPPFLGAGIRVRSIDPQMRAIEVEMKLRFWNRNYVGSHFGGSLYSMADPFFMLMLIENLGPKYIVWDKSATIRFRKPGRGKVRASFRLSEQEIEAVRQESELRGKSEPKFTVEVRDESGEVVAEVEKLLYVRLKERSAAA